MLHTIVIRINVIFVWNIWRELTDMSVGGHFLKERKFNGVFAQLLSHVCS